jgi:predicted RND superfamily exporter protein
MERVRTLTGDILEVLDKKGDASQVLWAYQKCFSEDLHDVLGLLRESVRTTSPMRVQDLPKMIQDRFVNDGNYLIKIYPERHVWDREPLTQFVQELRSVDSNVAGDAITLYDFTVAFRRACIEASLYAMAIIFLFLIVTLRGLVLPSLAMIPLIIGTIWTLGLMGLMKVDFNLANSIFMPLIVGAGVEYGVIIIHRWREGQMPPGHLPISTAKGVILAALTTTLGFGSLMISRHQGIFSLGFLALTGSLCVLLAAVVLLPAILSLLKPRGNI